MTQHDTNTATHSDSGKDKHPDRNVTVMVRTPAGASATLTFKDGEKVAKVIRTSVRHFVNVGELADDGAEYDLAVIREGAAVPMNEDDRLDDYHVVDGDVLHLVNRAPQVDG